MPDLLVYPSGVGTNCGLLPASNCPADSVAEENMIHVPVCSHVIRYEEVFVDFQAILLTSIGP